MTNGTHAVLTGPIQGLITLEDGTVVDATPAVIYVNTPEAALDAADKIGQFYEANGHPDDIEVDEETGKLVQRDFVYDHTPQEELAAQLEATPAYEFTALPAETSKD